MGRCIKILLWFVGSFVVSYVGTVNAGESFWVAVVIGVVAFLATRKETTNGGTQGLHYHYHASSEPMLPPRVIREERSEYYEPEWSDNSRLYGQQPKKKRKVLRTAVARVKPVSVYNERNQRPLHFRDL
jgi:hypothetical protein